MLPLRFRWRTHQKCSVGARHECPGAMAQNPDRGRSTNMTRVPAASTSFGEDSGFEKRTSRCTPASSTPRSVRGHPTSETESLPPASKSRVPLEASGRRLRAWQARRSPAPLGSTSRCHHETSIGEDATDERGGPGLGPRVVCGSEGFQQVVAADDPPQLPDPGETVVDPTPVDYVVVPADDERLGERDRPEAHRQVSRRIEQHRHARAAVVAEPAGVRPRAVRVGQDCVEIDAGSPYQPHVR